MSENRKVPEYLYHYTSINILAYILKDKQFRFSSLPLLDDKEEAVIFGDEEWTKYCFVSAWTDEERESIPMWKMYSGNMNGVRIRLPSQLFPQYPITYKDICGITSDLMGLKIDCSAVSDDIVYYSPIPLPKLLNANYSFWIPPNCVTLTKMIYGNKEERIRPKVTRNTKPGVTLYLEKAGKYKRDCWKFQREWRYSVNIYPGPFTELFGHGPHTVNEVWDGLLKRPNLDFSYYYLKVDPAKFHDMEITLGPLSNPADRDIVELLCKQHNSCAKIKDSELKDKIR